MSQEKQRGSDAEQQELERQEIARQRLGQGFATLVFAPDFSSDGPFAHLNSVSKRTLDIEEVSRFMKL
jgi:hypothetical protein